MKKLFAIVLALAMLLAMTACGTDTSSSDPGSAAAANPASQSGGEAGSDEMPSFKIGVAEVQANDEAVTRRAYYEDYIAPRYNINFVFSEQIGGSTDDLLTFIENCADAGCDAILSYTNDDIEQMTQVCAEYGMMYVVNTVRIDPKTVDAFIGGYDNFAPFGNDQPYLAEIFYNWLTENASEDGSEGFMITSALAYTGNLQQTEITQGCLRALQDLYGLTYDQDIMTLTTSSSPIEATNDKGINIYIYPNISSRMEGWLQGVTAALQTGKYATLLGASQIYSEVAVVVDEAEQSMGRDIKVACVATISDSLRTAFATEDRYGNPSINMATAKPASLINGSGFVQCYNMLTGFQSSVLAPGGEVAELNSRLWPVYDLETVDVMSTWDIDGRWIMDYDIIDSMLGIYNPDITNADLQAIVDSVTYDSTFARLGAGE